MAISLGLTGAPASRLSSTAQIAATATAFGVRLGAGFELPPFARQTPRHERARAQRAAPRRGEDRKEPTGRDATSLGFRTARCEDRDANIN